MSAEVLREAAVALREDWTIRAEHGDLHGRFHLTVADWLDAEAAAMDSIDQFNAVTSSLVREEKWTVRGAAMTVSQGSNGALGIEADTSAPALAVARAYLGADQ